MAQQTLPRLDRTTRAAGIISRQECVPQEDGTWLVRDTATGSGVWHLATPTSCDCYDASRGHQCKHQRACQAEAIALAAYAASWDRAAAAQQSCTFHVGQLVNLRTNPTGQPAEVIEVYRLTDGTERVRSTTVHTHATNVHNAGDLVLHVPQQPRCPMCGCPLESRQYYTGGRGYQFFEVCSGNSSHVVSLDLNLPDC
jgi:hypothetical protein